MRQDKTLKIRSNHISESPLHFALLCSSTCSLQLSRTWLLQLSSVAVAAAACWVDCHCHCRCRCRCHSCRGPLPTVPLGRLYRAVARFTILPAVMPGTKVQEHSGSDKAMVRWWWQGSRHDWLQCGCRQTPQRTIVQPA